MSDHEDLSFDEFDERNFPRTEENGFDDVVEQAISRRGFMCGALAVGTGTFVLGTAGTVDTARAHSSIEFDHVAANTLDTVTVPKGYSWRNVVSWGDPMWSDGAEFDETTRGTGESQERAFGDNNDGMALFVRGGKSILAVNNEYTNRSIIYANRKSGKPETADDVRKGKAAHGVAVIEIAETDGKWSMVVDSPVNRKITPDTPMEITGPARGHDLMKTVADPDGTTTLGTWNNCGNGRTPWGTYLTCEENFNGYFSSSDETLDVPAELQRYGIGRKDWGYAFAMTDERFDISKHPNEPNRVGYVVEIDPFDPQSTPRKLTALGRFKHENAELVVADNGHVVVYMGDDERGEFLYRYVSNGTHAPSGDGGTLLEDGKLYVARFDDNLRGHWIELTPEATGLSSMAEICIHTRQAASAVGATTMDRPEWVAANPGKPEIYCALTNNKNRGIRKNRGGDDMVVGGPNPRAENHYGQIVRIVPVNGDHTAPDFAWNLFVLAGNPHVHSDARAGSGNVTTANMFNSPDGLAFDSEGRLWIQTDGKYTDEGDFAGMGNNQMLLGDPATGQIRRFLVGPRQCEVTGITWSADKRTMFVGIQHPGEKKGDSHFPGGGKSVPRSGVIAIARDDGGKIG